MSGPVGLDYPALYLEAERLDIELSPALMRKIKALERQTLNKVKSEK